MSNVHPFPATPPDEDTSGHPVRRVPANGAAAQTGSGEKYEWSNLQEPDDRDSPAYPARRDRPSAIEGFERVPPQDLAAEQSVLGGMLLSNNAIAGVLEVLTAADYYRPAHELIHQVILGLVERGEPADPITVADELTKRGELTRAGGRGYLHSLVESVPTAVNAEYYAEIVHERAVLRRLVQAGTRIAGMGYAAEGDVDEIVNAAQAEIQEVAERRRTAGGTGPAHLMKSILAWDDFFATDFGSVQLFPGRLMAPGQQITLVGDGKAGKSLFMQEWAWRMATSRPFLDDKPQDPIRILYLDAENGQEQVQERLLSFGAGPDDMGTLTYASFPPIRPLDTPGGGQDLLALAAAVDAQLVVIDTVSRFISGPENDSDTWLSLYRHTLMPLKASGRASVRLDHFGKDQTRGSRGSSAKTQDVDHVWELTAQGGGILALKRTHTRTGVGPGQFTILRHSRQQGERWLPGHTRHVVMHNEDRAALIPGSPEHIAAELDKAGIPASAGRTRLRTECARLGIEAGTSKLEEVARIRKARENLPSNLPPASEAAPKLPALEAAPEAEETPDQTCPGQVENEAGQPPPNLPAPLPPLKRGQGGSGNPAAKPKCTICGGLLDPHLSDQGTSQHLLCSNEIDDQ